ncbi:MAG: ribonuclease Z [Bacteroidales bacterium OttesenSCG-928-I14]|jgi:ribonuclease Z|nr:ribonuclease Z [Bacteroidales bacterium OttesenSCG-928-I14]
MNQFEINILGCGSALSFIKHSLSSQIINFCGKLYMIDCGEGSQFQFRTMKLKFQQLNHIFISHLHGDHCFGLLGLIYTLGLFKRTTDLCIYSHPEAKRLFQPLIRYFCKEISYQILFRSFDPNCSELIYEDQKLNIFTIPLKHRVPTVGFLFEEKFKKPCVNIIQEMCIQNSLIKNTHKFNDFNLSNKKITQNVSKKTTNFSRKYAYCSDTMYHEKIIPLITNVDLLYHEATFKSEDLVRAKKTCHSSAKQAALIAKFANVKKLVIGHFSARYSDELSLLKEAQEIFPNTILANKFMVLPI